MSSVATLLRKANDRLYPRHLFHSPEWLVLGVNNVCNLHCKMCDVGVKYEDSNFYTNLVGTRPINMPIELIRRIIDQAAEHFPSVKLGYAFTEPLVYPHLIESLEYASEKKLFTSITTNGLTLRQKAEGLSKAGLNEVYLSLDGPPEIHNEIRGHKSSFQKAMQGIEALLEQPEHPTISIFCVITEWNIGHLEEFLDLFRHLPLKQVGFMHTNYTPQDLADRHNRIFGAEYPATASNMEEINLDKMDLDVLWKEMVNIKKKDYPFPVTFSPEVESRERLQVFYHRPEELFGRRCQDVFRNLMIKSDGSIIPAHGRCFNLQIGNLYEQELDNLWNSSILARFRQTLNRAGGLLPACSRCCSAFGK